MTICLWKHELHFNNPKIISILDNLPEVIKTNSGYWSKSDQCLFENPNVTHAIWEEDNGDIVLFTFSEGYIDEDLTEITKFSSIKEAENFVKNSQL